MQLFNYSELDFQSFGTRVGFSSLLHNRLRLGWKKTIGKITQPINFYSRYPEYHYFNYFIDSYIENSGIDRPRVLDVGSPKLFGLYLACNLPAMLHLTDISSVNIDEYKIMWQSIEGKAPGRVEFSIMDVREPAREGEMYDIIYSMSVIEHVEGGAADTRALEEMVRMLKPGGLLIFSIPLGNVYREQLRPLAGYDHVGDNGNRDSFFQRVYSYDSIRERLLEPISPGVNRVAEVAVGRKVDSFLQRYLSLSQDLKGLLGWFNPLISSRYNLELAPGANLANCRYGERHRPDDIYGDYIYCCTKETTAS